MTTQALSSSSPAPSSWRCSVGNVTKSIFTGLSGSISLVSVVEAGINFSQSNMQNGWVYVAFAVGSAATAGAIWKEFPNKALQEISNQFSQVPAALSSVFTKAENENLSLEVILSRLEKLNQNEVKDYATFLKQCEEFLKATQKITLARENSLKDLTEQYHQMIDSFLPVIKTIDTSNSNLEQAVVKAQSLLGNVKEIDLENGEFQENMSLLNSDIPKLIHDTNAILIARGQSYDKLQKELEQLKTVGKDLERIQEERKALAQDQAKLEEKIKELKSLKGIHA